MATDPAVGFTFFLPPLSSLLLDGRHPLPFSLHQELAGPDITGRFDIAISREGA